jgi:hypothetical protein
VDLVASLPTTHTTTNKVSIVAQMEGQSDLHLGDFEWSFTFDMSWDGTNLVVDVDDDNKRVGESLGRDLVTELRRIADEAEVKLNKRAAVDILDDDDLVGTEPTA